MRVLVVPRALSAEYYEFLDITARPNGEWIVVDRRLTHRRKERQTATAERRSVPDRRRSVPPSWDENGLIVLN
jgi:hypothetical protein